MLVVLLLVPGAIALVAFVAGNRPAVLGLSAAASVALAALGMWNYVRAEDCTAEDALLCIQTGARLADTDRMRFSADEFYMKTADQMAEALGEHRSALDATMEITDNLFLLLVPGALAAGLSDALFWWSLALSLAIAFVLTVPVNRWRIARGRGHAVVHELHAH